MRRWRWTRWALFLLPLLMFLHVAPQVWSAGLLSRNDPWVVPSISDQKQIADWLNKNTNDSDLVVCHWNIGWLLNCRSADLLQCTAWEGMKTHLFENGLPRERFRYEADILDAKFVVITYIDLIWTLQQPNVRLLIEQKGVPQYRNVFNTPSGMVLQKR
ncbi:MAG: hypothetical protein FJZ61_06555 [Chlamydiae bacterium]|nr:hypothetical protein [Chlamydiota bacterium]